MMIHGIAYLFDLDGVVIDTERKYTQIWDKINAAYPTGVDNFSSKIKGTNLESILTCYYPDKSTCKKVERMLYDEEERMVYEYTPNAADFLTGLRQRGIPTALVTSSNEVKMNNLYAELPEIRNFFDVIVNGDMVRNSKPDPEGYLLAARTLHVAPRKCAVFEDSLQGVKAGHSVGAVVCGIRGTAPEELIKPYCSLIVDNLGLVDIDDMNRLLNDR